MNTKKRHCSGSLMFSYLMLTYDAPITEFPAQRVHYCLSTGIDVKTPSLLLE